jgi:hypothetical protein
MPLLVSLADLRDVIVIVYGAIGILFFVVAIAVSVVLFFSVKGIIGNVRELIRDSVKPTLDSVRDTAKTIQGTTEFVGESAVKPIMRTYGILAGLRRGATVLAGLSGRKRR